MTESENLASEPKHFRTPAAERASMPFETGALPRNRHSEINERRAQTEDPDALRKLRAL
jgi:hypothetical protein